MHRLHKHASALPNDGKCCVLQKNGKRCGRWALEIDAVGYGFCKELNHTCSYVEIAFCECGLCGPAIEYRTSQREGLIVFDSASPNYVECAWGCRNHRQHNKRMRDKRAESNPCARCGRISYGTGMASVCMRWDYYNAMCIHEPKCPHFTDAEAHAKWRARDSALYDSCTMCLSCYNAVRTFVRLNNEAEDIRILTGRIKRAMYKNENRNQRQPSRISVQPSGEVKVAEKITENLYAELKFQKLALEANKTFVNLGQLKLYGE